jgi:hypothetical protein
MRDWQPRIQHALAVVKCTHSDDECDVNLDEHFRRRGITRTKGYDAVNIRNLDPIRRFNNRFRHCELLQVLEYRY